MERLDFYQSPLCFSIFFILYAIFCEERNLASFSMNKNQYLSTVHIFFFWTVEYLFKSAFPQWFFWISIGWKLRQIRLQLWQPACILRQSHRNKMCKCPPGCMHHPARSRGEARGASATPWTVAHQTPLSTGFPRPEYWSALPFPSPRDLPDPGIESMSLMPPALTGRFFTTSATWEAGREWHAVPI